MIVPAVSAWPPISVPPLISSPATRYTTAGVRPKKVDTIEKKVWPVIACLSCSRVCRALARR